MIERRRRKKYEIRKEIIEAVWLRRAMNFGLPQFSFAHHFGHFQPLLDTFNHKIYIERFFFLSFQHSTFIIIHKNFVCWTKSIRIEVKLQMKWVNLEKKDHQKCIRLHMCHSNGNGCANKVLLFHENAISVFECPFFFHSICNSLSQFCLHSNSDSLITLTKWNHFSSEKSKKKNPSHLRLWLFLIIALSSSLH